GQRGVCGRSFPNPWFARLSPSRRKLENTAPRIFFKPADYFSARRISENPQNILRSEHPNIFWQPGQTGPYPARPTNRFRRNAFSRISPSTFATAQVGPTPWRRNLDHDLVA